MPHTHNRHTVISIIESLISTPYTGRHSELRHSTLWHSSNSYPINIHPAQKSWRHTNSWQTFQIWALNTQRCRTPTTATQSVQSLICWLAHPYTGTHSELRHSTLWHSSNSYPINIHPAKQSWRHTNWTQLFTYGDPAQRYRGQKIPSQKWY